MPSDLKLSVQSVTPDVTLTLSDPYIGSAYSPTVDVTEVEGGHEVTITHKAPSGIVTDTFDVLDGVNGTDGVDGVSPTVEIESTSDAHTITITDADGAHSYTVDTYADEEAARATAESSRVAAETARVTAEQARATAESSRAAAESARVTAEASRATAEQSRAAAESSRAEAEQGRVTAESVRATAESARATAEQGRATAEQSRATAETARASAESVRVSAETARVSAESARATAETARANAETARASAEAARATAESARATAESTRATEWATIKAEAEDAISAAEDATDAAESAASDATAAAAEARAASAATWLAGNVLFGELAEGAVLTADDAYSAPPKSVEVYGVSTQSGTPTPDAPVEIKSVDDLTLHVCGKNIIDTCNDPTNPDKGWSSSGGGTVAIQYDSTNGGYYTTGHRRLYLYINDSDEPITLTVSVTAKRREGTANYGMLLYANNAIVNRELPAGATYYTTSYTTYSQTLTLNAGNNATIVLYNQAYIQNIQLEIGTTATAYEPYIGQSISIPLSNHIARSLPDGTRDVLTLTYIGPSTEHEGWGVFAETLVQHCKEADMGELAWRYTTNNGFFDTTIDDMVTALNGVTTVLCDHYNGLPCMPINSLKNMANLSVSTRSSYKVVAVKDTDYTDATDFTTAVTGYKLVYPLDEPITTDLGEVELPILPNPLTAWADGGSAQPTLALEYERSLSIVIPRIEAAISDLATS